MAEKQGASAEESNTNLDSKEKEDEIDISKFQTNHRETNYPHTKSGMEANKPGKNSSL